MQLLSQHVRCDQREATVRNAKSTFAIRIVVLADHVVVFDFGAAVDNAAANTTMLTHLDLRQTTDCSTRLYDSTLQLENNKDFLTLAPEMTQPPDTIDSMASPFRSESSKTNFAGGFCC